MPGALPSCCEWAGSGAGALQIGGGAELRAVLTARKLAQSKLLDVELSLRGILRGFGLKVGLTTRRSFPAPFASWSANHPTLQMIAEALLSACEELNRQLLRFEASVRNLARNTL
jgi:hypothetical protein